VSVPLNLRRSPKRPTSRSKRPRDRSGVIPEIFVRGIERGAYGELSHIHARIQLRRAKYRYLVWWEGGRKREFYLGQVKNRAPERGSELGAGDVHQVRTRAARRRGKKNRTA
jgi:hypothetical protein